MKRFVWLGLALVCVGALFVSACYQAEILAPPNFSGTGYIRPLAPGHPLRVLGRYPGTPDAEGIVSVRAVGKGIPPDFATSKGQATLLAERAAIADGYRKLAEKIHGLYVESYNRIANGIVDYDRIRMETETWLRGAEVQEIVVAENGITEAYMRSSVHVSPDHILYQRTSPVTTVAQPAAAAMTPTGPPVYP